MKGIKLYWSLQSIAKQMEKFILIIIVETIHNQNYAINFYLLTARLFVHVVGFFI